MSEAAKRTDFKGAKLVDYTGQIKAFTQMSRFGKEFLDLIRECKDGTKAVVIVDRGYCGRYSTAMIVRDHVNLSGDNPLVGPNHPAGERFPIVQGIYFAEGVPDTNTGITAGLKEGILPQAEELSALRKIGVDNCSYNLVPSMLVAAHAGWKVMGILLAEGESLNDKQLQAIQELAGRN